LSIFPAGGVVMGLGVLVVGARDVTGRAAAVVVVWGPPVVVVAGAAVVGAAVVVGA